MSSPYGGKEESSWKEITSNLISEFPLTKEELIDVVVISWKRLWNTQIGDEKVSFLLKDIDPQKKS